MQIRLSFHEIRMKLLADWKILTTDPERNDSPEKGQSRRM